MGFDYSRSQQATFCVNGQKHTGWYSHCFEDGAPGGEKYLVFNDVNSPVNKKIAIYHIDEVKFI